VADLDILAVDFGSLVRLGNDTKCSQAHNKDLICEYTSLDSWDEVLDYPETVGSFVLTETGSHVSQLSVS
jgi:hypothetical protein